MFFSNKILDIVNFIFEFNGRKIKMRKNVNFIKVFLQIIKERDYFVIIFMMLVFYQN